MISSKPCEGFMLNLKRTHQDAPNDFIPVYTRCKKIEKNNCLRHTVIINGLHLNVMLSTINKTRGGIAVAKIFSNRIHSSVVSATKNTPARSELMSGCAASTYVPFGFKTVYDGEKYQVRRPSGQIHHIDGPKKIFLFNSHYEKMVQHTASESQYVSIEYTDGNKAHIKGPTTVHFDSKTMLTAKVHNALKVDITNPLVVLKDIAGDSDLKVRTVWGPTLYFPEIGDDIRVSKYYAADESQYLQIVDRNGEITHESGPTNMLFNPFTCRQITVLRKCVVDADMAIYVYNEFEGIGKGKMHNGPCTYVPKPYEIVMKIDTYSAKENYYVEILKHSGEIIRIPGPTKISRDPLHDKEIMIRPIERVSVDKAAIIYDTAKGYDGSAIVKEGPYNFIPESNRSYELVKIRAARSDEYLATTDFNGVKKHIAGPCRMVDNPYQYKSICVMETILINHNEAVVVYNESDGKIVRKIIKGPASYIPATNEWLHNFSWHGAPKDAPKDNPYVKQRDTLKFNKLKVNPGQMFYNINGARTKDDALISVRLAIFYENKDIEKMLDNTSDVIAEFMNGASSDITDFLSRHTYEELKSSQLHKLNETSTYPALLNRALVIGYGVNKVVFRGYETTDVIQKMYDGALEQKTKLKLDRMTTEQAQELETYKLEAELSRNESKHKLDKKMIENATELAKMKSDSQLELDKHRHAFELGELIKQNNESIRYLSQLSDHRVDLTRYLTAKAQGKPGKLITYNSDPPTVHMHEYSGEKQ